MSSRPLSSNKRWDYLGGRAFRRFAGTLLRLLVTGFLVLAASNKCRMPCSNSSTALSKAPSCPTRVITTDRRKSNDGARNTSTVSRHFFLANKARWQQPDSICRLNEGSLQMYVVVDFST